MKGEESARAINKISIRLMTNYLKLLCLIYKSCFLHMHHRHKENILASISRKSRRLVQEIDRF